MAALPHLRIFTLVILIAGGSHWRMDMVTKIAMATARLKFMILAATPF